jgi:hypothetical protein
VAGGAAQDDIRRIAFELHRKELANSALFYLVAQPHELGFPLVRFSPLSAFKIIHGGGADSTWYISVTIHHGKQDHHPVRFITAKAAACQRIFERLLCIVAALAQRLYQRQDAVLTLSFRLCGRRIDIGYSAKAIGFGVVRSGDKRAAHFRAVPTRYDTKPERLLCFDVARREILHGSAFMCTLDPASNAGLISDEQIISSILVGEPGEVRQHDLDQIAVMRICRSQVRGI